MKSKKASAKRALRAPQTPPLSLSIDYPQEGDILQPGHYSIRLGASGAMEVQLRIDSGDWRPCREAAGYFWFDWQPGPAGGRVLEARARRGKGRWGKTALRGITVTG